MSHDRHRVRRAYQRYNAALSPLLPALGAYTLYRRYGRKKSAESLHGQWGGISETLERWDAKNEIRIWLHAVSVGESLAARPVLRALRAALPDAKIFLSTTTDTGQEIARAAFKANECDAHGYFPIDVPIAIRRLLKTLQPDALLMMETELWPNALHLARESGAKTFLVNGRVSDNLLARAPKLRGIWRWMMNNLSACLMRTDYDAKRLKGLGGHNVVVTGDVKLDAAAPEASSATRMRWRQTLEAGDGLLWVAGSTHPGEEELILRAHTALRKRFPALKLILAPRHVERANEVETLAHDLNQTLARRTCDKGFNGGDVLLLDTVGELGEIYAAADAAFVGGSLIQRGGHNVLEPVLRGVPVVFGPHVQNFREAAALVERSGCGKMVNDEEELAATLGLWLSDESERLAISGRAQKALAPHRGAADRVAAFIAGELQHEH